MNITANAASLDWRGNNKGTWKALVKNMTPDSAVTFVNGYTATVSGRTVSVANTTAPTGVMTYQTDLEDAVSAGVLYGAGTAYDSVEAVAGDKTVRMGSINLGSLSWNYHPTYDLFYSSAVSDILKNSSVQVICDKYVSTTVYYSSMPDQSIRGFLSFAVAGDLAILIKDTSFGSNNAALKTSLSGVMLYYEKAEPTTSTETPQSLSLTTGDDTLSGGSFDTTYEGTDYDIVLEPYCKFLYRNAEGTESIITNTTTPSSKFVHGGVDKLINLTRWFGEGSEPSIATFYDFYPTWKNYDIPYNQGSVLNYKGTGVQTIGFNAYNHAAGTAALLGGNKYQICGMYTSVSYVDVFGQTETITPDSDGIFTPTNDGILTVVGGNNTDTCVHLCWSGYKNYGEPEYKYEPFTSNVKELPILAHYPDGMNGFGSSSDELTTEQKIVRWGVKVFNGTELFTVNGTNNIDWTPGDMTKGSWQNGACSHGMTMKRNASTAGYLAVAFGTSNDSVVHFVNAKLAAGGGTLTVEKWQAYLTEQYNAGTPVTVIYPLATPVVTQLDQPLNLAYPVNDFGTEHSLPQNTTTLVTTDLKALIKYNTDYMRMNSQLSGIFPTVKSLARQEQDGYIMKKDDTAPNATVGGAFNLIDRNAEGTERQFSFDTAGGTQDITDGTAVAKKSMGTTLNLNQLVHDTNQNTVTGNGQVEVEDAVAGDVTSLVVEGRSLVKNQLVPPSLEETEDSANGVIEVTDAVVGDAKGLVMTAPRSVVVNQLIQNGNFADGLNTWTTAGNSTFTVTDNVMTMTTPAGGAVGDRRNIRITKAIVNGHIYICTNTCYINVQSGVQNFVQSGFTASSATSKTLDSTWTRYSRILTATSTSATLIFLVTNDVVSQDITSKLKDVMLVDLTQYFNGDQTLIDSITSWDDLVAYDPRFASYVEYNTGTVEGVQPSVKTCGANIFDQNRILTEVSGATYTDGYYRATAGSLYQAYKRDNGGIPGLRFKEGTQYSMTVTGYSVKTASGNVSAKFYMRYTDGTTNETLNIPNDSAETVSVTSIAGKTVEGITFSYASSGNVYLKDICIREGTATSYEPYHDGGTATAPAPLFAVGDAADEFEVVSGKLTHQIRSYTFTGNETWQTTTSTQHNHNVFYVGSVLLGHVASFQVLCSKYVNANMSWNTASLPDKVCMSNNSSGTANILYVVDDSISTPEAMAANMAGSTVYYELATPTEELLTPVSISLQQGSNVALQTDGGRTTPFSLTYDGTEFALPLDSTHKYAFSDNGTKSIITGSSEQAVTGGQDMLVDVTRMFNGDTTAINAITSWADMAAVMPEYASDVAYNPGEVIARSGEVATTSGDTATFTGLHGIGSVKDTQNVVTGERGVKIGNVDLGTLNWSYSNGLFSASIADAATGTSGASAPMICGILTKVDSVSSSSPDWYGKIGASSTLYIRYSGTTNATIFKSLVSGITCYYELAEPTTTSLTPQPLTFVAGLNNVHEENMDITGTPINMEYTGTDYSIITKSARKYVRTVNGTTELVTGVSSVSVRGGRDNLIDLTRMFGAGLEPGTLDAFYALFPAWNGYRLPYNKGSLLNFKGTGLKSVGFNQFSGQYSITGKYLKADGTTTTSSDYNISDYLRAIPGQVYRLTCRGSGAALCWYKYDKTFISGTAYNHNSAIAEVVFTAPTDAYWVRFSVYVPIEQQTCFYFQWSGTRNGDYEPYWDYVRPIPTLTYFPDGMNGRGDVYDEINPRQAVKRFGKVDLGTLEWTHVLGESPGYWRTATTSLGLKRPATTSDVPNMISDYYVAVADANLSSTMTYADRMCINASGYLCINTGSTTESPSGWLVYELAAPVVTTFPEEISATARISDYGTEECLPTNGYDPVTAPFRGMVLYQDDYARTITKLPENYQSQVSMAALLQTLGTALDLTVASVWNASTSSYTYSVTGDGVPGLIASAISSALTTLNPATSILISGTSYTPTLGVVTLPDPKVEPITTIQAGTSSYTLADGEYSHAPTADTTYALPAVTDSTVVHEIVVNVLFASSSTTVTFKNSSNVTVEPLSTPSIENGSLICYLCRWEPLLGAWSIMPIEMGVQAQA